jgi:hypothetical protein
MTDWRVWIGPGRSGFLAPCSVSPLLPWRLGVLGLPALTRLLHRDAVLLPRLAGFLIFKGG